MMMIYEGDSLLGGRERDHRVRGEVGDVQGNLLCLAWMPMIFVTALAVVLTKICSTRHVTLVIVRARRYQA